MAMSDCVKCWDTPCSCGWDYRGYSIEYLEKMDRIFKKAIEFKKQNPEAKFSGFSGEETSDDKAFMKFVSSR